MDRDEFTVLLFCALFFYLTGLLSGRPDVTLWTDFALATAPGAAVLTFALTFPIFAIDPLSKVHRHPLERPFSFWFLFGIFCCVWIGIYAAAIVALLGWPALWILEELFQLIFGLSLNAQAWAIYLLKFEYITSGSVAIAVLIFFVAQLFWMSWEARKDPSHLPWERVRNTFGIWPISPWLLWSHNYVWTKEGEKVLEALFQERNGQAEGHEHTATAKVPLASVGMEQRDMSERPRQRSKVSEGFRRLAIAIGMLAGTLGILLGLGMANHLLLSARIEGTEGTDYRLLFASLGGIAGFFIPYGFLRLLGWIADGFVSGTR